MQIKVAKINKNDQNYHKLKEVLDQQFNVFFNYYYLICIIIGIFFNNESNNNLL